MSYLINRNGILFTENSSRRSSREMLDVAGRHKENSMAATFSEDSGKNSQDLNHGITSRPDSTHLRFVSLNYLPNAAG